MPSSQVAAGLRLAFFVSLALASLGLAGVTAYDAHRAKQSATWPTADGRVLRSGVQKGCRRSEGHFPVIEYTYALGGGTHRGDRVRFGKPPCGDAAFAQAIAAKYPAGAPIQVAVNPDDMFESVLLPGEVPEGTWLSVSAMILLFLTGAALATRALRG